MWMYIVQICHGTSEQGNKETKSSSQMTYILMTNFREGGAQVRQTLNDN